MKCVTDPDTGNGSPPREGWRTPIAPCERRQARVIAAGTEAAQSCRGRRPAGTRLFCVSPMMPARASKRYRHAPTRSDAFDVFVLADSLRHEYRH
jgi:hypothetical protein